MDVNGATSGVVNPCGETEECTNLNIPGFPLEGWAVAVARSVHD